MESCQKCPKIDQIVEDKITAFLDYGSLWSNNEKLIAELPLSSSSLFYLVVNSGFDFRYKSAEKNCDLLASGTDRRWYDIDSIRGSGHIKCNLILFGTPFFLTPKLKKKRVPRILWRAVYCVTYLPMQLNKNLLARDFRSLIKALHSFKVQMVLVCVDVPYFVRCSAV